LIKLKIVIVLEVNLLIDAHMKPSVTIGAEFREAEVFGNRQSWSEVFEIRGV
jgi:hypothetical protein